MNTNIAKTMSIVMGVLLGITMLIPGLSKLLIAKPANLVGMLAWAGPTALFFAWLLTISEIVFGIAILARWKTKYTTIPPAIIMLVAAFTVHLPEMESISALVSGSSTFLVHLTMAAGYLAFGAMSEE